MRSHLNPHPQVAVWSSGRRMLDKRSALLATRSGLSSARKEPASAPSLLIDDADEISFHVPRLALSSESDRRHSGPPQPLFSRRPPSAGWLLAVSSHEWSQSSFLIIRPPFHAHCLITLFTHNSQKKARPLCRRGGVVIVSCHNIRFI